MAKHAPIEIHVRSKDCENITSGYNSHIRVDLETSIRTPGPDYHLHVSFSSAEIPFSWYMFSDNLKTNKLYVDGALTDGLSIGDINYNVYELADAITADTDFKYSCVYNQNTNKMTLTNTDATEYTINFSHVESQGMAKVLGFALTDQTVGAGGNITSDWVVNLQTVHKIYANSDIAVANVITTQTGNYESVLETIPLTDSAYPGGRVIFNPYQTAPFATKIAQAEIRSFEISLRDQNSNLLQLNNVNYELSILVEVHRAGEEEAVGGGGRRSEVPGFATFDATQNPSPNFTIPPPPQTGTGPSPFKRARNTAFAEEPQTLAPPRPPTPIPVQIVPPAPPIPQSLKVHAPGELERDSLQDLNLQQAVLQAKLLSV